MYYIVIAALSNYCFIVNLILTTNLWHILIGPNWFGGAMPRIAWSMQQAVNRKPPRPSGCTLVRGSLRTHRPLNTNV